MKIISFAWTTPALLAGAKTCTRRDWALEYALRFQQGEVCQAWNKSPRFKGKDVARVRLLEKPYQENTKDAPDEDYKKEGFAWLKAHGILVVGKYDVDKLWNVWKTVGFDKWVVRFELLEVL
jgi:hypothetical protein